MHVVFHTHTRKDILNTTEKVTIPYINPILIEVYRPEKYLISRGRKHNINNIVVQKILVKRRVSISCPLWAINRCNVNLEDK